MVLVGESLFVPKKAINKLNRGGTGARRNSAIKKAKVNEKDTHFAYLFASPLIIDLDGEEVEDMLDEISFKEEFKAIIDGLKNADLNIKYRY